MGIGVNGRFGGIINNPREMNNLAAKGPNIEKDGKTVKELAAFPEEKPDVQKTHYNSRKEFDEAMKNGTAKAGDTYFQNSIMYYVDEIKEDGTHTRHNIGWQIENGGTHTLE